MSEETQQEPSMEDILSSIRKILAEDEASEDQGESRTGEPSSEKELEPGLADEEQPFHLTQDMLVDEEVVVSANSDLSDSTPEMPDPMYKHDQGLVSSAVEEASSASIAKLANVIVHERAVQVGNPGVTLEQLVREICTPVLKQWLDQNLPYMVERVVRQEIERIVSRSERM